MLNKVIFTAMGLVILFAVGASLLPPQAPWTAPRLPTRTATAELALVDRSCLEAQQVLAAEQPITKFSNEGAQAYRDAMSAARTLCERTPGWRAACQRVANGDQSGVAAMDEAIAELRQNREELAKRLDAFNPVKRAREESWGLGMTMRGYRALKTGMHKDDVDLVLDRSGVEHLRSGSLTEYVWRKGTGRVSAVFEGDKLVSKSQMGLK